MIIEKLFKVETLGWLALFFLASFIVSMTVADRKLKHIKQPQEIHAVNNWRAAAMFFGVLAIGCYVSYLILI